MSNSIILAITGASGSVYAERFLQLSLAHFDRVYLIATDAAQQVVNHELTASSEFSLVRILRGDLTDEQKQKIRRFECDDLFAPIASGSSAAKAMVILPCSMGTLSRIAQGVSANLLERAADVMIKEKRRLIIAPREMPLSAIHLRNMLSLAESNVQLIPPTPGFYQKPQSIMDLVDFVVGRIFENLGIDHELYRRWNQRMR